MTDEQEKLNDEAEADENAKNVTAEGSPKMGSAEGKIFAQALRKLNEAGIPYLVGAAFARHAYTGVWRKTKDLDLFLKAEDLRRAMDALEEAGFKTQIEYQHWLAKAIKKPYFVDLIFGTGHGQIQVDDSWFEYASPGVVLAVPTRLVPIEEMIALGVYVAERSRFDASDVAHLIRASQGKVNWERVLDLLGENRELLLLHLILFDIIYPGHSDYLPKKLMVRLFQEVQERWESGEVEPKAFRGSILDPFSFSVDVEDWGYEDRRNLEPIVDKKGELL